ncbi:lyase family protein [Anabaena sp. CCY 9402-a]|uniref:lyase family protein n=1 Tax=Anabaena sp. CCY 9402-a TaxID=3103867 RepID=UPI0039C5F4B1
METTEKRMRYDKDSLGTMEIPNEFYYGIQTIRGIELAGDVTGMPMGKYPRLITALCWIKKACAKANASIGKISPVVSEAICTAADDVISGKIDASQFPSDIIQGGGGVTIHMNINEVLANRANEIITGHKGYDFVHPNNHINVGQSTNDVLPTAMKLLLHLDILDVIKTVHLLEIALAEKIEEFQGIVKLGRTCLQDAVPIMVSSNFSAYLYGVKEASHYLKDLAEKCLELPLGGTAIGTGLGVSYGYVDQVYPYLAEVTGLKVQQTENIYAEMQFGGLYSQVSATYRTIAITLSKMATDLRILSSGNRTGLMEIILPAVQPGSSFMPGKVNPAMPELLNQIAYQICGNDVAVTMAVEGGELELNVWEPIVIKNMCESAQMLTRGIPLFVEKCLRGLKINEKETRRQAENTLSISSVIATIYGYEAGLKSVKYAYQNNTTLKQAVVELGIMPEKLADEILDPSALSNVERSTKVAHQLLQEQKTKIDSLVANLSLSTRQKVFDALINMAWVDGSLAKEESLVMEVVANALQLGLTADEVSRELQRSSRNLEGLDAISSRDRELIYLCTSWLSQTDKEVAIKELEVLKQLQTSLGISDTRAEVLEQRVTKIRTEKAEFVPQWEDLPWWEEFKTVLVRALDLANVGELDLFTRQEIFELMGRVALADQEVTFSEIKAMETVAEALQLGMTNDDIAEWLKSLSQGNITPQKLDSSVPLKDRKLAYFCATWLATIDEQVAEEEISKLEEIRAELELDKDTTDELFKQAKTLWAERGSFKASKTNFPWWEDVEKLLNRGLSLVN